MSKPETPDPVGAVQAQLAALEPKAPGTGRASVYSAVSALYPDLIAARREKNYTDAELVEILKSNGIKITLGTFGQYMRRIANERGDTQPKRSVNVAKKKETTAKNKTDTDLGTSPKPSEIAAKPTPNPDRNSGRLGHKLNDDDI